MSASTTTPVSGTNLLEACGYDRRLTAAIIAPRDDWKEILDSFPDTAMKRNVAHVVWQIREALGKDFDYARKSRKPRHKKAPPHAGIGSVGDQIQGGFQVEEVPAAEIVSEMQQAAGAICNF